MHLHKNACCAFWKTGPLQWKLRCTNISPCAGSLLCTRKSWLRYTWGLTQPLFLPCHYLTYWRNSLSMIVLLISKFPGLQWLNILDLHASHFKSFGTGQGSLSSKLINHCFFIPLSWGSDPCDPYPVALLQRPGPGCSLLQLLLSRDPLSLLCATAAISWSHRDSFRARKSWGRTSKVRCNNLVLYKKARVHLYVGIDSLMFL